MSAVSFASAGYICQVAGGSRSVPYQEDLSGAIVAEEALSGALVEEQAASGAVVAEDVLASSVVSEGVLSASILSEEVLGGGIVADCDDGRLVITGWTTSPGPYTEADIYALNDLQISNGPTWQVTLSPVNAYVVAAYSDAFPGDATDFLLGSFLPGGVAEVQTGLPMNLPGGPFGYSVTRSNLIQLATDLNWQRLTT